MKSSQSKIRLLCNDLSKWLVLEKTELTKLNGICTRDTEYSIGIDFEFISSYLSAYVSNNVDAFNLQLKPKGKIVIILSFNEPLTTSIVPVLNALVAGNHVVVRPSTRGRNIFQHIWEKSGLVEKYGLKLSILAGSEHDLLENELADTQALYFFGGHKTAKVISGLCAKHFVEFYPEIEAADFKVVYFENHKKLDYDQDTKLSLHEAFTHCGQSCQRIQGIFVHEGNFDVYSRQLIENFKKISGSGEIENYISPSFEVDGSFKEVVETEITDSKPLEVIRGEGNFELPVLVIQPNPLSIFARSAYFLPIIWVAKYSSDDELLKFIKARTYHLGINIQWDNQNFIDKLVSETGFTRYSINTDHTRVRTNEGWEGRGLPVIQATKVGWNCFQIHIAWLPSNPRG